MIKPSSASAMTYAAVARLGGAEWWETDDARGSVVVVCMLGGGQAGSSNKEVWDTQHTAATESTAGSQESQENTMAHIHGTPSTAQ